MTTLVRPYRSEDGPVLFALSRDTIRRVNQRDYAPEQIAAWSGDGPGAPIDPVEWVGRFETRAAFVAEVDGVTAGFADLEGDGHVDRFYVSADHQGAGVGAALMRAVLEAAERRGIDRLHSEVSLTARGFFERFGFEVVAPQTVRFRGVDLVNFRMQHVRAASR